jgi:hypothetical protein
MVTRSRLDGSRIGPPRAVFPVSRKAELPDGRRPDAEKCNLSLSHSYKQPESKHWRVYCVVVLVTRDRDAKGMYADYNITILILINAACLVARAMLVAICHPDDTDAVTRSSPGAGCPDATLALKGSWHSAGRHVPRSRSQGTGSLRLAKLMLVESDEHHIPHAILLRRHRLRPSRRRPTRLLPVCLRSLPRRRHPRPHPINPRSRREYQCCYRSRPALGMR